MAQNNLQPAGINETLTALRAAFSNSNMVRMREALRYLSGPKLSLFISIPFYIHANREDFPGYVQEAPSAHGILNFKESGFYKAGLNQGLPPESGDYPADGSDPCVLGLYHIGSLGTFTQSSTSDFDYWVIIDKQTFTEKRHYNFQKKLDAIVHHARETFGQEVSFFIMDQEEIRRDCYTGLAEQETLTAPKLFLKEEFYRTFLYIAGKLPLWTVLPPRGTDDAYTVTVEKLCAYQTPTPVNRYFMDLGRVGAPEKADTFQGILWHICKSRSDPVKALIKATMIFSHEYGSPDQSGLLCDQIKAGYAEAGIDDYRADPYKTLFDRVIAFHQTNARESLNLIKNAIFLRLCEYPNVKPPEPGSPKKQLLDRYIREWNLKPSQVKKILTFQNWAEGEKQLLEKTFIKRLEKMYTQVSRDMNPESLNLDATKKRNLKILFNKARERLNQPQDKIQPASTFMQGQPFQFFLFRPRSAKGWALFAYRPDGSSETALHQSDTFLGLMGWIMENRMYHRSNANMKLDTDRRLFGSGEAPVTADAVYMALQPVRPLTDNAFEYAPQWKKLAILLKSPTPTLGVTQVEFLALNTWGELYVSQLKLDTKGNMTDRYKQIAKAINQYTGDHLRLFFFQMAEKKESDMVFLIKHHLDTRFIQHEARADAATRPLLDKL